MLKKCFCVVGQTVNGSGIGIGLQIGFFSSTQFVLGKYDFSFCFCTRAVTFYPQIGAGCLTPFPGFSP